jgi:hypothetical protein
MTSSSKKPPFWIFFLNLQKVDNASNAVKFFEIGWKFNFCEQNYGKTGFWRHFEFFDHFVQFKNPKLAFLDKITYCQQIRIKKWFFKKPLGGVSVEFLFKKIYPTPSWFLAAISQFSPTFYFSQKIWVHRIYSWGNADKNLSKSVERQMNRNRRESKVNSWNVITLGAQHGFLYIRKSNGKNVWLGHAHSRKTINRVAYLELPRKFT